MFLVVCVIYFVCAYFCDLNVMLMSCVCFCDVFMCVSGVFDVDRCLFVVFLCAFYVFVYVCVCALRLCV